MNDTGIETAILSVTAPGAGIIDSASGSAAMARRINEYAATIRDSQPAKFGFFAAVPDLVLNITAVIEEIDYALDVLKADGITLFTRYGKKHQYLGNPAFEDVWAHLDRRKAVVFIHPTHPVDTELINPILLQPSIDYPHETTRTVTDMLISGTRARYPNSKVILSHAGGTLPYLINRLSVSRPDMYDRFMKDAKSFHYDLALSSAPIVMKMLIEFVGEEKLLIGSDFPYAPLVGIKGFAKLVDEFEMRRKRRERIYWRNAAELFPRLVKEWEKKGLAKL